MPLIVRPVSVMIFDVPTPFVANVAAAEAVERMTVSLPCLPDSAAEPSERSAVAAVVESYTRLLAVIPVTVSSFVKILAVVVGCVSV